MARRDPWIQSGRYAAARSSSSQREMHARSPPALYNLSNDIGETSDLARPSLRRGLFNEAIRSMEYRVTVPPALVAVGF